MWTTMWTRMILLIGLVVLLQIYQAFAQTCDEIKYTLINDVRRSTAYKTTTTRICDRGFIKDDEWYRFESVAGNTMPIKNPGIGVCGTYVPIWLQGAHPTTDNAVVDRKACAAVPFIPPAGCGFSYNIKVIKCGAFYLYRLKEPKQCDLAYCAGDKLPATKCSVTGETLPVCPGAIPRLTVHAGFKDEDSEEVTLRCYWESPGNLTNVEYEAKWYGDATHLNHKIYRNLTGLDPRELLFEPPVINGMANKNGYEFHKNVFCKVRARYKTGTWSKWVASRTIYTGMEVTPTFIPIFNDCGEKDREVIITLRPHLPIRKKPVRIGIATPKNKKLIDEICVVGDKVGFQDCGIVFDKDHRVGRPLRFKLMTNCGTGDKEEFNQDDTYELQHNIFNFQLINRFWINHNFPVIKIRRRKFRKKQCWSTGDPHFSTFDGKPYDFFGRGTFLFYKNRFYGTEIQVRQRACNGGTPSCNCGIAIREKLFYKIYDMCYTTPGRPWWENNVRSRLFTHQLRDFKLSRFYSKVKQYGSNAKYEITLPSGIKVIVNRQNWGMNLYVWAPMDKNNPSEGLCGNNNGDPNDDFGQFNSPNQFGEHWRIRAHITLFDYKGNKFEEDQLDDGCDEKICVCSTTGGKFCGAQAENICFPNLGSNDARAHHEGSGIGECPNRPKRALVPDDDTVDDQDSIPSFNPAVTRVNLTLTWPTPSGITKENVTQFCEKKLRYSKAGQACGQVEGVDVDGLVQQCITDIQATEDFSWAAGNFAALETSCIANIFNNISSFKNTTNGTIELDTDVLTSLCPNDCSDRGNCSNSTCICDEDYTSPDCSVSLKDSPLIFDIRKSGLCDRRRRPCRNVGIFGYPLLDSENLTCHVQEHKVINSTWSPSNTISLYQGILVDLTELKCSLPESPVNIGEYGNPGVTAAGLKIAISNNRINASVDSVLFITYDSVCQECNTSVGCKLRTDACFISGHCFARNESKPQDWCRQCLPELSTTSWLERRDNRAPVFTTSKVFYAFKGRELRVHLSARDPENRTFHYSFAQTETFGASLSKNGSFRWTKNSNDSTVFKFNVADECGAYSTVNITVVLRDCPCQNSGECLPDYRYLDGAGNFTCSCPAEYNGTLCELDVDECAVSKPCFNGTCKNEKPGFSCSCLAGYTGDLCQTDIDECASNPCFLGVTCKDVINGFTCGPCPDSYTGNGENCSRLDGQIDECVKNPKVCHSMGTCVYSNGSYACQCTQGYTGDGKNCADIDECQDSPCDQNAQCENTNGSFSCQCNKGFTGDGVHNCTDINECFQSPTVCPVNAECKNSLGSYWCQCRPGFTGDANVSCTDIDECQVKGNSSVCHSLANCSNTAGSFSCQCKNGYTGDGKTNCADINECLSSSTICPVNADCRNTLGSYWCQCRAGFTGNAQINCTDIDECKLEGNSSVCHALADCSNTAGSFSCQCKKGYTGNGKTNCSDIDECRYGTPCHRNADCTNTNGSFSCKCYKDYFGDGVHNCTVNQPPQFTIPAAVYAILNKDFEIQISAVDPEGQDVTFALLLNRTGVAITPQGQLTIRNFKDNDTIHIRVVDQMGANNSFALEVRGFECRCQHKGECYQKKNSRYPVKPSDYLCRCEEPYTGDLCETRSNPCDGQPCYPGLKCSPAQNSDGFACEACPLLFEGDGKNCELSSSQEKSSVGSEMKLINQEWSEQLAKKTSKEYKSLASQLIAEIRKLYQNLAGFSFVIIKRFRRGSVVVEFELIFTKKAENPLEPLYKVAETGKLGNMTFEMENLDDNEEASGDDKILGLDKTIFIIIIAAIVAFVLIVVTAVWLRKRQRLHKKVQVSKRLPCTIANPQAFTMEGEQPEDGASGEEIDLKVFDNETVCVEEVIKLQP